MICLIFLKQNMVIKLVGELENSQSEETLKGY
jgi:hypothetical protein